MKPSVGRIVHFYTSDQSRQSNGASRGPYAAMIVQVHSDICVSLNVFPPFAEQYTAGSVMRLDPTLPGGQFQSWEPPPYVPQPPPAVAGKEDDANG